MATYFIPAVIAVLAAWIASKFAAQRGYEDRVWARKADAYSSILEALHNIQDWYDAHLAAEFNERELSDELKVTLNTEFASASKNMRREIAREVWLLPAAIQDRLEVFQAALGESHDSWFEHIDACSYEVKQTIVDVTAFASADQRRPPLLGFKLK